MKKANLLVLGLIMAMGLSSCIKEGDTFDLNAQYEIEKPVIEAYAKEHLDAPQYKDIQGKRVWFEVVVPGNPTSYQYKVSESSSNPGQQLLIPAEAIVSYEGRLVNNNTVFESKEDQKFIISLNSIIPAWQLAFFPEEFRYDEDGELLDEPIEFGGLTDEGLKVGSVIRIVTPSYWAYQNVSQGSSIPANSPLFFEITVSEIKDYEPSN